MLLQSILALIVSTIAGVLTGVLLLRFWMQAMQVKPPFSMAQFMFKTSNWLVQPLRRCIPGWCGYDWASLVAAFLVTLLSTAIESALSLNFSLPMVLGLAIFHLLQSILFGLMILLLIEVVLSWINPVAPIMPYVRALNDPLLRPLRRIIPLVGAMDFSVLVALLLLQIARQVVSGILASL